MLSGVAPLAGLQGLAGLKFDDSLFVGDRLDVIPGRDAHDLALEGVLAQLEPVRHQTARGRFQTDLWVVGGAIKLRSPIAMVLFVPLPILRLVFLDLQGRWHLSHVVSPLLVRSNLGTPST